MDKWWKELFDDKIIAIIGLVIIAVASAIILKEKSVQIVGVCVGAIGGTAVGKPK